MNREALFPICGLAMLIGGCPKRQAPSRIVYTPAPPAAAASTSTAAPPSMVIEEPAPPPEPEAVSTRNVARTKPAPARRHVARTEQPASTEPSDTNEAPETPPPPPGEVPALEPRESSAQVSALRQQVQSLQEDVRARLSRINQSTLSQEDRKTLDDARTFFTQSSRALEEGDLQRALNLARKASLLVAALEQ